MAAFDVSDDSSAPITPHDLAVAEPGVSVAHVADPERQRLRAELVAIGGRSSLLRYSDVPEVGIDITAERPKVLKAETVQESDVVITMGCGDACPFFPGKRYEDWKLDDPAGQGIEAVRPIRDEIKARVQALLAELL